MDANPTNGFTPERTFKNPYNSQEEVTAIIQESDLAQELKDEYMEIAYGNLGEVTVEDRYRRPHIPRSRETAILVIKG